MTSDAALFATQPAPMPVDHDPVSAADDVPSPGPAVEDGAQNRYPDVFAFVEEYLVHVYARVIKGANGMRWCSRWHHHPEAVARLTALWRAFEALRTDPGAGASTWWLEHADPTMTALTAHDGAFRDCAEGEHGLPPVLPTVPASQR